jgi:hypothetical protein
LRKGWNETIQNVEGDKNTLWGWDGEKDVNLIYVEPRYDEYCF